MTPLPRRPPRRPARRRKETQPDGFLAAAPKPPAAASAPLSLDAQRYYAFRAGVSKEELAARENILLSTVERSIERMEIERERYSEEAIAIASRRTVLAAAPAREASLLAMLTATREKLTHVGGDPNQPMYVEAPDHDVQLKAIAALSDLIESLKANSPLVSVSQQNNLQQNFHQPGQITTESIIREVRLEKGLTQAIEVHQLEAENEVLPDSTDFELERELAAAKESGEIIEEEVIEAEEDEL